MRELPATAADNAFLSCDWGTSQFRLRLVQGLASKVLAEILSADGVASLSGPASEGRSERFRAKLEQNLRLMADRAPAIPESCPIVVSGMASSSIGWRELPYATLPFDLNGLDLPWEEVEPVTLGSAKHPVVLLSGVRDELDIMRGEEIQLLGLMELRQAAGLEKETIVVLPGTHSKHVQVKTGKVLSFVTFITGELFQVLSQHSVLRHSVATTTPGGLDPEHFESTEGSAFDAGVRAAATAPLLQQLFRIRARHVLQGVTPSANRDYLSGLLIGSEIAALRARLGMETAVILCGGNQLAQRYERACRLLGIERNLTILSGKETEELSVLGQARYLRGQMKRLI